MTEMFEAVFKLVSDKLDFKDVEIDDQKQEIKDL